MGRVSAAHKADSPGRRTANYKPNIWNYEHLQSLTGNYDEEKCKREAEILKEEVCRIFGAVKDPLQKLELIDGINKLALPYYFEEEISQSVDEIACMKRISSSMHDDPYYTALCFRILRQHGYHVSQDAILQLLDDEEKLITRSHSDNRKAIVEIFEASHVALENECLLDRAKAFATKNLKSNDDQGKIYSTKCPLHWSVSWFLAKKHMHANYYSILHRLARLSFNMVQVQHQKDLKDILRWWTNLGLSNVLTFTRDRVIESFLWAVGVAYEPQYGNLRKWLTKGIVLVLIMDDVYDIYGSNHELEQFTTAVERWDPSEVQQLPDAIKRCFWVLYDTVNDIDQEIQREKGWNSVLPHLKITWTGFCKAMFLEAKWYNMGHSPSLREYLDNGWTSSAGPVLSLHVLLGLGPDITKSMAVFNSNQEIIHHVSLIIRLCNDQGTSKAEIERGDAPSSILCYVREANVTEKEAQEHIRNIITESWKKINGLFIRSCSHSEKSMIKCIVNGARVANFIYQNGDGFGVPDTDTRDKVLSCLIEPLPL
ncbi:Alpha-farnesene synthase [Handroanthus impetiginosus]|uniref:Alpha-farnesene synthase n=1 Tax=Handroanthus impetiginosus TaxID=429701 RepID=A0A2G9H9P8_9LAMI|nr:Alpha-farnesene synthase [Handroanthus impetiginosus]